MSGSRAGAPVSYHAEEHARIEAALAGMQTTLAGMRAEAERPVTSAPDEDEYPGPMICAHCRGVIRPARAGYERKPASHGTCAPCEQQWRLDAGLPTRSS